VNTLQEQFVTEARELIRQATDDLIALERDGSSSECIDRVFRAFHTLKGSAGVVELPAMSLMLHAAEDLLTSVRQGTLGVTAEIIDQSLAALDQVASWVDDFEVAGTLPAQAGEAAHLMAERLRSLLPTDVAAHASMPRTSAPPGGAPHGGAPLGGKGNLPEWVLALTQSQGRRLTSRSPASTLVAISYEPLADCFFNGDDPLQLMRQVPELLAISVEPREAFPPLAEFEPYACNIRLRAISAGNRDDIARIFRLVPDQVRILEFPEDVLPAAPDKTGDRNELNTLIRAVVDAQCQMLRVADRKDDLSGCIGSASRVAVNALRHGGYADLSETVEHGGSLALSRRDTGPLLAALEQVFVALDSGPSEATPDDIAPTSPSLPSEPIDRSDRVLRVNETKLNALINLAGELIVAKNALAHSARQVDQELVGHEIAAAIRRDHDAIERLVVELHGATLQLRMVPVAQVFRSFPRLVRDLSRQLGKNVTLVTRGDTTEADKAMIDRLFEPLVHLVRNAVDHGIESPEQRHAAGKSATATISLQASRVGDRLLIEASDDGRGIDAAIVRRKASERGLMSRMELAALTDEQAIDLIFAAGFSTATAVSDISGRGIGMDVVRTTVEQIGGRVSLTSKVGEGTKVRLDLPITIAMSRIMVVEAGGQLFGISMDAISETVRLTPDRIVRIKSNDGFVLRDRIVPIVLLAELMKLPERSKDESASRLFLIIEAGGRIAAVEIDAIRDRLDVVLKPMQGLLAGARGYAGTTLLGDGRVLLVLDVKEILP
jgi:two-component system, chemotaxis family, sensor kinase CheA